MTRSSQKKPNYDVRISALESQVSELAANIAQLQRQADPLREWIARSQTPQVAKRGRKPKMPSNVLEFRDRLIHTLEWYWPELRPHCVRPSPKRLREMLIEISHPNHGPDIVRCAQHLLDHFEMLLDFLKSDRYRGDPRQIANAVAGVPHVSWWRSLRFCGEYKSQMGRGKRAIRDYLRRKRPEVYRRMRKANGDIVKLATGLKSIRSSDEVVAMVKHNADFALEAWLTGVPGVQFIPH